MKTIICSLLARIFFNLPNFNLLEYNGLDFDPVEDSHDDPIPIETAAVMAEE